MYALFRSLLFRLDPETAHGLTLRLIRLAGMLPPVRAFLRTWFAAPHKPVQAFGLTFPNPVGLAAGYDKDGLGWRGLACLGFGHIEVGTVTPRPQPGNPRPRLYRLVEDRAVINRMGFPGKGASFVARQLRSYVPQIAQRVTLRQGLGKLDPAAQGRHRDVQPATCVIGVNFGKNKDTPLEEAAADYLSLMEIFAPLADYLAVNVSSPNTVGLRQLQARQALQTLLSALAVRRQELQPSVGRPLPLLVKLAPDLTDAELDDALDVILATGMDGVIATNTTLARHGVRSLLAQETGGLSGAPLRRMSTEMIRKIAQRTHDKLPIIGVGGVASAAEAQEKLDAGATLVQLYTGLIYEGPGLVRRIVREF